MFSLLRRRPIFAWALYDWANSAFATTVMAGFFPIFFRQYWSPEAEATVATVRLGIANGIASFVLAVLAPILGAIADRGGARVRFLAVFTALGVAMTVALYFVEQGNWQWAAACFVFASIGFWGGMIFYDSLLIDVAPPDRLDFVSGYGYSLGYLGGGVLFAINVWMTLQPELFDLPSAAEAVRLSFQTVGLWWAVFAIPLFLFVREQRPSPPVGARRAIREGLAQLAQTFHEVRRYRPLFMFLLAYWLYIDGVNTIMKMAVDYGMALGFPTNSLIVALLVTQFVGFPAALLFGWLGQRTSPLAGIFCGIVVYSLVTIWAVFMSSVTEFYLMAVAIGLVQGAIQSLSRSYYGSLIPPDRAGEFFGFYNMMGKFAAVLGPFLMAITAAVTGSSRTSLLSLVLLFIAGGGLLLFAARTATEPRRSS